MKGFTKHPVGRDIAYVLEANPRVRVIRGCKCAWNCDETWLVQIDEETVIGGYFRYFKDALRDAAADGAVIGQAAE